MTMAVIPMPMPSVVTGSSATVRAAENAEFGLMMKPGTSGDGGGWDGGGGDGGIGGGEGGGSGGVETVAFAASRMSAGSALS